MGETHDELLEVDLAIAVIIKDVDDPPKIARYTESTFFSKFFAFQTGRFWAAFLGPRGPLVLPLVNPYTRTSARAKNLDTYIQAYMPHESSGDSSNQPIGHMGSPRRLP